MGSSVYLASDTKGTRHFVQGGYIFFLFEGSVHRLHNKVKFDLW